MTLIVGIPADDGVVFASDTQVTMGEVRANTTKIFQLNARVLWGGSGDVALIQRVAERLERLPDRDKPLSILRDVLAITVKDAVHDLLATDFRTDFFAVTLGISSGCIRAIFYLSSTNNRPLICCTSSLLEHLSGLMGVLP